jgi:Putative transmembrane protein (PGPGW)
MQSGYRAVRRVVITAVGVAIIVLGGVFLLAPGPGFLVIALGFLVLSVEYAWARRAFDQARGKALDLSEKAVSNRVSTALTILFALAMIAFGVALGVVPTLPFAGWAAGGSLVFSGLIILGTVAFSIVHVRRRRHERRTPAPGAART